MMIGFPVGIGWTPQSSLPFNPHLHCNQAWFGMATFAFGDLFAHVVIFTGFEEQLLELTLEVISQNSPKWGNFFVKARRKGYVKRIEGCPRQTWERVILVKGGWIFSSIFPHRWKVFPLLPPLSWSWSPAQKIITLWVLPKWIVRHPFFCYILFPICRFFIQPEQSETTIFLNLFKFQIYFNFAQLCVYFSSTGMRTFVPFALKSSRPHSAPSLPGIFKTPVLSRVCCPEQGFFEEI